MPYFVGGGRQRWSQEPPEARPAGLQDASTPTLVAVPRALFCPSKGEAGQLIPPPLTRACLVLKPRVASTQAATSAPPRGAAQVCQTLMG